MCYWIIDRLTYISPQTQASDMSYDKKFRHRYMTKARIPTSHTKCIMFDLMQHPPHDEIMNSRIIDLLNRGFSINL